MATAITRVFLSQDNTFIGECADPYSRPKGIPVPTNIVFVCKFCGAVFGRALVVTKLARDLEWIPYVGCCHSCKGSTYLIPGSMLSGIPYNLFSFLPKEVLTRELFYHIDFYLKGLT